MAIDSSKIVISENAISYLKKKNKMSVTIGYPDYRTNGDFAVVPVPEIYAKKPKKEDEYNLVNIEGIDVYISKMVYLPVDDNIVIDINTFLKMTFLTVKGFKISNQ